MNLKSLIRRCLAAALVALMMAAGSGCATQRVEAWERDYLARPEMAWDPDGLTAGHRSHTYFSKEASSGGATVGGGGCGCN